MVAEVETHPAPLAASATGERFLRIRLKGKVVERVLLTKPRLVIGRSPRADIVLDKAAGVSREHAHILIVDDEVLIEDLSSRNGTFVNGRICQRRTLEHGDRIAIGSYRMRYRDPTRSVQRAPTAQEKTAALLLKWNDAAIVERPEACPLCRDELGADGGEDVRVDQPGSAAATARVDVAAHEHGAPADGETNCAIAADPPDSLASAHSETAAVAVDDPDGLASTDAMPHLVVADSCPTAPSAIVLVPDGMREPPAAQAVDDAIPSGLASTGDTMEGMFPELFLVPGSTAYLPQHTDHRVQAEGDARSQGGTDDIGDRAGVTQATRFRRTLKPGRRLPTPRKR